MREILIHLSLQGVLVETPLHLIVRVRMAYIYHTHKSYLKEKSKSIKYVNFSVIFFHFTQIVSTYLYCQPHKKINL